jgi:ABC-type spermidine/putrescine transport system permease subunit II
VSIVGGRLLTAPLAAIAFALALAPALAALLLGAHGVESLALAPLWAAASLRSVLLASLTLLIGWPIGFAASLAVWGARRLLRRVILSLAILVLLLPPAWGAAGLHLLADALGLPGTHLGLLLLAHATAAAALVLLILTSFLNRLDPLMLPAARASGASNVRAWSLLVMPAIAWPMLVSAAAAWTLSIGERAYDTLEVGPHLSLDRLSGGAPAVLLMAMLAVVPLAQLGLLGVMRRR